MLPLGNVVIMYQKQNKTITKETNVSYLLLLEKLSSVKLNGPLLPKSLGTTAVKNRRK